VASIRNFLAKFPAITTVLNLSKLAHYEYLRTLEIPGRQHYDNIKIKKKDG
jgi:hypothetical protein